MSKFGPEEPAIANVTPFTTTLLPVLWPSAVATVYVNAVEIPLSASLVHAVVFQPSVTPDAQNVPAIAIAAHEGVETDVWVHTEPFTQDEHAVYPAREYLPKVQGTKEDEEGHALPAGHGL